MSEGKKYWSFEPENRYGLELPGLMVGLILASGLNWTACSRAEKPSPKQSSASCGECRI